MHKIIFVSLFATAFASLQQQYGLPSRGSPGTSVGGGVGRDQQIQNSGGAASGGFNGASAVGGGQSGAPSNGGGFFASSTGGRFSGSSNVGEGFDISTSPGFGGSSNTVNGFDAGSSSGKYDAGRADVRDSTGFGGQDSSSCSGDQVLDIGGNCVEPEIIRNIYHYTAPQVEYRAAEEIPIPTPKLLYNVLFVRTPEGPEDQEPVVIPPPQQKTIVYVLHKDSDIEGPERIEIPSAPHKPEVFYVSYNEGDNPTLPIGIDLQSALARAVNREGQTVEGIAVGGDSFEGGAVGGGIINGGQLDGAVGGAIINGGPFDGAVGGGSFEGGAVGGGSFEGGAVGGGSLDVRGFGSGGQVNGGYQIGVRGNGGQEGQPPSSIYRTPSSK